MDYPELNLLVGLGLAITLGVNLGLLVLINRLHFPSALKIAVSVLAGLGLLAAGYVYTLLFPSLSPSYRAILALEMALIAGLAILAVRWLSRVEFSRVMRMILTLLLVTGLALNAWLVLVLYRSLVPVAAALLPQNLLTLNPYPISLFSLAIPVCLPSNPY